MLPDPKSTALFGGQGLSTSPSPGMTPSSSRSQSVTSSLVQSTFSGSRKRKIQWLVEDYKETPFDRELESKQRKPRIDPKLYLSFEQADHLVNELIPEVAQLDLRRVHAMKPATGRARENLKPIITKVIAIRNQILADPSKQFTLTDEFTKTLLGRIITCARELLLETIMNDTEADENTKVMRQFDLGQWYEKPERVIQELKWILNYNGQTPGSTIGATVDEGQFFRSIPRMYLTEGFMLPTD